jgi:hypothetical protein
MHYAALTLVQLHSPAQVAEFTQDAPPSSTSLVTQQQQQQQQEPEVLPHVVYSFGPNGTVEQRTIMPHND